MYIDELKENNKIILHDVKLHKVLPNIIIQSFNVCT